MQIDNHEAFVSVVIPCLNEAEALGPLVRDLLAVGIDEIVVVDGGSQDGTVEIARAAGARVVVEPRRGYGRACASGVAAVSPQCELIAFLDGDGSDDPAFAGDVIGPVMRDEADFCLGSRILGRRETGSLTPQQVLAGHLAGWLIWAWYGARFTDMSPYRAMPKAKLAGLGMSEMSYGWNLEMQMRVAARKWRIREVPVDCRRRAGGVSKVSGNWRATLPAALTIARTFLRLAASLRRPAIS